MHLLLSEKIIAINTKFYRLKNYNTTILADALLLFYLRMCWLVMGPKILLNF